MERLIEESRTTTPMSNEEIVEALKNNGVWSTSI